MALCLNQQRGPAMGFRTGLFKLKRSLNNLAFRMSFVKLAPGSSRPLLPVASFLILAFTVFVLAGGLFILVGAGTSVSLLNVQQGLGFVYPHDINNQTPAEGVFVARSEEHTSELQSPCNLVC